MEKHLPLICNVNQFIMDDGNVFKKIANKYKILALSDMDKGVTIDEMQRILNCHVLLENYEVCEGLKQAIEVKEKEFKIAENSF